MEKRYVLDFALAAELREVLRPGMAGVKLVIDGVKVSVRKNRCGELLAAVRVDEPEDPARAERRKARAEKKRERKRRKRAEAVHPDNGHLYFA